MKPTMLLLSFICACPALALTLSSHMNKASGDHYRVLVLGGGVAGVISARTLHEHGIDDFLIIEARSELGGRMQNRLIGETMVELGPNWVEGTQVDDGPSNPIWDLARKHDIRTVFDNDSDITTYDETGFVDYNDVVAASTSSFEDLVDFGGSRVQTGQADLNARTGYSLVGAKAKSPHEQAAEYLNFDLAYSDSPERTSLIASSLVSNATFNPDAGGFSDESRLCVDQRGFKTLIQSEASEFLQPGQVLFNATVKTISYSSSNASVTLHDGRVISADYIVCTFSVGVLQQDDVTFLPRLPLWKMEAIHTITMATYTKIFLRFAKKFWFDTQVGLFAHRERGRYPVWESLDYNNTFPGSGLLFVTVTGDMSTRIENLSDHEIQQEVMDVLRVMYPHTRIPEPLEVVIPRWQHDPLFRGSYSNWPASFTRAHHKNLRASVGKRLWFAGEATSLKYFGFLHGAYFEGKSVTEELLKCIKQHDHCQGLSHTQSPQDARVC